MYEDKEELKKQRKTTKGESSRTNSKEKRREHEQFDDMKHLKALLNSKVA